MASTTGNQQPFRFLNLPTELRCWVYEYVEFPTTWHVLDRTRTFIDKRNWPIPPKAQVYDSRVTLIRPHTPLEILMTCHLVNEEAHPILKHRTEQCKLQPVRYLVDYSASWALVSPSSALRSCLGAAEEHYSESANRAVKSFLRMCTHYLSQTRRTQNGSQSVPVVEMTITHESEIVYGMEVMETLMWLSQLKHYNPARLVVIYKSPLPRLQMLRNTPIRDSDDIEDLLLRHVPREQEDGDQANAESGVFVRPLEEEAFKKHVEGLESY